MHRSRDYRGLLFHPKAKSKTRERRLSGGPGSTRGAGEARAEGQPDDGGARHVATGASDRGVAEATYGEEPSGNAPAGALGGSLVALGTSPYLQRLRALVAEIYIELSADRRQAIDAVEKTIAALARPDVPLDPALKSQLIAKLGELLTKLERLQVMLPRGETLALRSLDRAGELLRKMEQAEN